MQDLSQLQLERRQIIRQAWKQEKLEPQMSFYLKLLLQIGILFFLLHAIFLGIGLIAGNILFWTKIGVLFSVVTCPLVSLFIITRRENKRK